MDDEDRAEPADRGPTTPCSLRSWITDLSCQPDNNRPTLQVSSRLRIFSASVSSISIVKGGGTSRL